MATLYKYGNTGTYAELTRTNMNHGLTYRTRALSGTSNKGVNWSVAPGDQIRFSLYSTYGYTHTVSEIPASGSTTTNGWFFGAVTSLTTGQIVKPLIGTTYDQSDGKYHATIPAGCNYFVIVTPAGNQTGYYNNYIAGTVEKYVEGRGWIPVEPFIYDTNNGWEMGSTHEATNNTWS